jgi:hypothetical protein
MCWSTATASEKDPVLHSRMGELAEKVEAVEKP